MKGLLQYNIEYEQCIHFILLLEYKLKRKNKRPTGFNGHLSKRDFTLTFCQKGSYLHNNSPIMEKIKVSYQYYKSLTQQQSMCCIFMEYTIMHIHYKTRMAMPQHKMPRPGGHGIHNFGRPFLGHFYYLPVLSLSDLSLEVEKKIFEEVMFFHYMIHMATPQQNNPCPRGHEINNFVRPFLRHYYCILGLYDICMGVEKKI